MITYKDLFRLKPGRVAMTLLIAAASLPQLLADNKITVEDFTIINGETAVVSVKMENDADVHTLGTKITLPAGMEIVPQYDKYVDEDVNFVINASRTYDPQGIDGEQGMQRHQLSDSQKNNTYIIAIVHDEAQPFIGQSGDEIFHFVVKATDGMAVGENDMKFSEIQFSKGQGDDLSEVLQDDFTVKVNNVSSVPPVGIITTDLQNFSITPGAAHRQIVTVSLENDTDISGLQAKIILPQGLKFVTGVEGFPAGVSYSERSKKLQPKLNRETGVLSMIDPQGKGKILAGSGEIFAFLVEADTSLPEESEIDITTIRLTTEYQDEAYTIKGEDIKISVNNPDAAAKPAADKAVADAEQAMTDAIKKAEEALKAVTDQYQDYMDSEKMDAAEKAAQDAIDALKKKIEDAWNNGELANTDYSPEVAACEQTVAALDKAGQGEVAKAAADNAIADAEKALADAKAALDKDFADVKDLNDVKSIVKAAEDAVNALKSKVNEAYGKDNLQNATTSEWVGLAASAIDAIVPTAEKARQEIADAINAEAYGDLMKEIKSLNDKKAAADAAIDALEGIDAAEFKDQLAAAQTEIDNLKGKVDEAYQNKQLTPDTDLDDIDNGKKAAIEAMIEKAVADAKAAVAKAAADQAIAGVEKALADAKAALDKDFADVKDNNDVQAAVQAAESAVEALKSKVDEALKNGNLQDATTSEWVTLATSAIDAIVPTAEKVRQEGVDDVNAEAYGDLMKVIKSLNDKKSAAADAIDALEDVDPSDYAEQLAAAQTEIDNLKDKLDKAYENKQLTPDTRIDDIDNGKKAAIEAMIQKAVADAKAEQAQEDALDEAAKNKVADLKKAEADAIAEAGEGGVEAADYAAEKEAADKAIDELEKFVGENDGQFRKDEVGKALGELETAAETAVKALEDAIAKAINDKLIAGDINKDGKVDASDLALFVENFAAQKLPAANTEDFKRYDANGNGVINVADAQAIFNLALYGNAEGKKTANTAE